MQHCLVVCIDKRKDGPSTDRQGIDASVFPHLENRRKPLACTISDKDDGVQDGGEYARRLIDYLVCEGPKLLHIFNSVLFRG